MTKIPICSECKTNEAPYQCKRCNIYFCFVCSEQMTEQNKLHSERKGNTIPLCPKCRQPIDKNN